ncbi:hypothetical protein [Actinomadura atramentaria]|uniref:hypothetical protein n=1 Tax=Actinomadura atramentaria TaxID=1990 RepID=UPI000360C7BB|nr:hypothetical protein [Actinomadura atramentaria]
MHYHGDRDRLEGENDFDWGYRLGVEDTDSKHREREWRRRREAERNAPKAQPWTYSTAEHRRGDKVKATLPCACHSEIWLTAPMPDPEHADDQQVTELEGMAMCRTCHALFNTRVHIEPDEEGEGQLYHGAHFQLVGDLALSAVKQGFKPKSMLEILKETA